MQVRLVNSNFAHGSDVHGLNKILKLADFLAELVNGDLLVLHDTHHLQLLDAIADRYELACAPDQALHLNGLDLLQHGLEVEGHYQHRSACIEANSTHIHVGLIIPRFHVEED